MGTTKCIRYKGIQTKKVESGFSGGSITSDAGVLLLRQANQQTKFIEKLSQAIEDRRHPSYVDHAQETMLKQRIFGIGCGYEDVNDQEELRKDPMFQVAANREPGEENALASPPTICRFENAGTREDAWRMAEVFVEQFIASYPRPPKELTLDFDATDDRTYRRRRSFTDITTITATCHCMCSATIGFWWGICGRRISMEPSMRGRSWLYWRGSFGRRGRG